jgi:hypothetical protein
MTQTDNKFGDDPDLIYDEILDEDGEPMTFPSIDEE